MAPKQTQKRTEKEYRSIMDFKRHFFPKAYEEGLLREKQQDPESFGKGLARELLDNVRQKLIAHRQEE